MNPVTLSSLQTLSTEKDVSLSNKKLTFKDLKFLSVATFKPDSSVTKFSLLLKDCLIRNEDTERLSNHFSSLLSLSTLVLDIRKNGLTPIDFYDLSKGIS